jgi:hypothetical protein
LDGYWFQVVNHWSLIKPRVKSVVMTCNSVTFIIFEVPIPA